MAEVITRFKLETTQYDSKLRDASKSMSEYARMASLAGNEFGKFTQKNVESARALGNIATSGRTAQERLKELVNAFNDVSRVYNNLTQQQQQSDYGKAMAESLRTLQGRIKEAKSEMYSMDDQSKSTGSALEQLTSKLTVNIDAFKMMELGIKAGKAALDVAKDAFFATEGNIDEWGRTVKSAEGAYDIFLETLNNGNWSNFFSNLESAVQGGRELYDVLDRLGSIKSNNQAAIAIVQGDIQKLRLMKQSGEEVDDQIEAATKRLAYLQNQEVTAGKIAGTKGATEVIRNGINSINGAPAVSTASINAAVADIMRNGQDAFDKYARNYRILSEKARSSRRVSYTGSGGTSNSTIEYYDDLSKLTPQEARQYALARSITSGESRINPYIQTYGSAAQAGTNAFREEFKGMRYATQSVGGSGKGGSSSEGIPAYIDPASLNMVSEGLIPTGTTESMSSLAAELRKFNDMRANATSTEEYNIATEGISNTKAKMAAQETALQLGVSTDQVVAMQENIQKELDGIEPVEINIQMNSEEVENDIKDLGLSSRAAAAAVGQIGAALSQIEDPAAKVAGIVMQAVANIALSFSSALASPATTAAGVFGWIAAAASGVATMYTTIQSIHNATGFALGGEIKGNSYSNDQLWARVNAGETILTKAQSSNIAGLLKAGGSGQTGGGQPYVSGEMIYLGLSNYMQAHGMGELVTTK